MNQLEKKCFIITPIGDINSEIFRKAKGVIDNVIKPILQKYGFSNIEPSYEITKQGTIEKQIINRIIDDDLVIVNLTGNNPNVTYELAIRHIVAKPVIAICEEGTKLSFDIKDIRTIFYKNDMLGAQELKNTLENFIKDIDYSKKYFDNPIYNAINNFSNILILNEKHDAKLNFSLITNGNQLEDNVYPIKTSPSGYSIKIYNIGEKPFYLKNFNLEYAGKTIVACILSKETVIAPYKDFEYELKWQEYDDILYYCKKAKLKKCNVSAYEIGGKVLHEEIDLDLPYIQTNFRKYVSK